MRSRIYNSAPLSAIFDGTLARGSGLLRIGRCFFKPVLRSNAVPRNIVTERPRSYRAAKADIPELFDNQQRVRACSAFFFG